MRITVFTGNQPRHLALIEALAGCARRVYAVHECTTVFPGRVDDFFRRSPVMREYFRHVISAESLVFGRPRFSAENVRTLSIRMGDVSRLERGVLAPALKSDLYVVFGASYIKGPLCDHLVRHAAVNIHMGVSPHYRGSSTNFWALRDGRPELVGATIHRLSTGLDSGPILRHAFPEPRDW
ncbi:MAG: methionyl-tRNA formyltransferase, partial [Planctomycetota bacterium]